MRCGGSKGARHLPIRLGLEGEGVTIRPVDIKGVPDVDAHNPLGIYSVEEMEPVSGS